MNAVRALASRIRETVHMEDVVRRYYPDGTWRGQYVACPFHGERTPSLRVYERDYHCFGCGAHGDAVDFVVALLGVRPYEAIQRLAADFGLTSGPKRTLREVAAGRQAELDAQRARHQRESAIQEANEAYFTALDEWLSLERNLYDYAPAAQDAPWDPRFVEALRGKAMARYALDQAEERRCQVVGDTKRGFDAGKHTGHGRGRAGGEHHHVV